MIEDRKKPLLLLSLVGVIAIAVSSCYGYDYRDPILSKADIVKNIPALESYVASKARHYSVEKLSLSIVVNGEILYSKAFGATVDEQFCAASITKAFLAYAALLLVDENRLSLDQPLSSYSEREYFPTGARENSVTLRMVLNHTSGMSNGSDVQDWRTYVEPGKEFHYSTSAFIFLLNILQDIVGGSLDSYVQERIFAPLGMRESAFSTVMYKGHFGLAQGGIHTTPRDLALFFNAMIDSKVSDSGVFGGMLSDSVRIDENNSWGLGVGLQHGNGLDILWQTGNSQNIWHSLVYYSIHDKTGIIIMTKGKNGYKICQDIAHEAIGGSYYGMVSVLKTAITPR